MTKATGTNRTRAISALFAVQPPLSADNKPRIPSGSVNALRSTLTDSERENEELRQQLESGASIITIDPDLIDASPIVDRFHEADDPTYEALKASIAQRGQEIPILVRPLKSGRYQSAYGHRRVRVARELGLSVKAIVRELTDEDLIVAQGVENAAREDLSFIERAFFAARLEDSGYERSVIQEALAIDRAEASKLIAVARAVPTDIAEAIGRAPKVGRGRWQALADALKDEAALERTRSVIHDPQFRGASDDRFLATLKAATATPVEAKLTRTVFCRDKPVAKVQETAKDIRVTLSREGGFARYLMEQLPDLFEAFERSRIRDE